MLRPTAKDIRVAPVGRAAADRVIRAYHYSGKVVPNTQVHLGVFLGDALLGAMQFGPPMDKRKVLKLVAGTAWHGMLELNRMAFHDLLPRNSESRALAVAMRMIRRAYPQIEWVLSFADGCQSGDGAIYRAAGFVLTGIKENTGLLRMRDGTVTAKLTLTAHRLVQNGGKASPPRDAVPLKGHQLRYIRFLAPGARERLAVPELPFTAIAAAGAGMYRGEQVMRGKVGDGGLQAAQRRCDTDLHAPTRQVGSQQ